MAKTLQVREVPDDVHAALRARAVAAGMSLSDYVLQALTEVAARPAASDVLKWASGRSGGASTPDIVAAVRRERDARS
jgi:plasmid stability protein